MGGTVAAGEDNCSLTGSETVFTRENSYLVLFLTLIKKKKEKQQKNMTSLVVGLRVNLVFFYLNCQAAF